MNLRLAQEWLKSKEYYALLKERAERIEEAEHDLDKRQALIDRCAVDPIFFIETFGWTVLVDLDNRIVPFFLFQYQKEDIWRIMEAEGDIEKEHELLIDKIRKMGLTWTVVWYMIWRWLFKKGWSGFVLSRTEVEVDMGDADPNSSIFGKIRWSFAHMPEWIMPGGYAPKTGQRGTKTDRSLKITNPDMGTQIVGSTTNSGAGRSRRYSFTFIDEAFAIEAFSKMYRSLQSVSRVKLFVSTAALGTVFRKFKETCEAKGDYISHKWSDHPWNDKEWFDEMIARAEVDPELMKEIEVDYKVSKKLQYYPEIEESKVRPLEFQSELPLYVMMDYGSSDLTVFGYYQFDGHDVNVIGAYANHRRDLEWYIPFLNPSWCLREKSWASSDGSTIYDLSEKFYTEKALAQINKIAQWRRASAYFGEAAHFQKHMPANRSVAQNLVKFGIKLDYNRYAVNYDVRQKATAMILPRVTFNQDDDWVMKMYEAIANSRFAAQTRAMSRDASLKPAHDKEIADYRSCFENGMVNVSRVFRHQREGLSRDEKGRVDPLTKSIANYLRI